MHLSAPWGAAVLALALFSFEPAVPAPLFSAEAPKTASCNGPQYAQFDFWIGDWNAYDVDQPTKLVARNRVERILDGCALMEDYRATDGSRGESFTIFDASRQVWHQTWVTNRGKLLVIEGGMREGAMVLSGTEYTANGKPRMVRGVWKPVKSGVRETATTSDDGGATWRPWFDILFRTHGR